MIDRKPLLDDLKKIVTKVEADLLARSTDPNVPEIGARLQSEYDRARAARRTAATLDEWRTDRITQAAVAWVLSCVFVRFLEDNDLITPPRIAGPGDRLSTARDSHQHFFTSHPRETDRDFLLSIFDELAALPGTADIFGPHNPLREIPTWLSGDAAREIIQFFQKIDANTGTLIHDFTDPQWDSRFLGDLYQDLSAYARERYALLQTPHFVEQFLLDRTLEPALDEFGVTDAFKMIDPACGSGHLVLGSFARILDRWQRQEPATPVRELVRRSLAAVHGVDINPFAVAIARFRLLLVAMRACGVTKLSDAPAFHLNIECGDSLLHTPLLGGVQELFDKHDKGPKDDECDHAYASEDLAAIKRLLRHGQYHAVMANPPYITPKDPGLRDRYRDRFSTCHMKYSLAVPFMEHIFKLCVPGGFTGQITANSFMKREFGKKLIENFFPFTDLTHVIDTSGAYIPGHGTPTVILFGRQRRPVLETVRAVMGIRGEPATPQVPERGLVWQEILAEIDRPGNKAAFVTVSDVPQSRFHKHPWSVGGGGASELKRYLEETSTCRLGALIVSNGPGAIIGETESFAFQPNCPRMQLLPKALKREVVVGPAIRDWCIEIDDVSLFPYDETLSLIDLPEIRHWLWPLRSTLESRQDFGNKTYREAGRPFWEYHQIPVQRNLASSCIAYAAIASHNHFAFSTARRIFRETAPMIVLPEESQEHDYHALLAYLNSSIACFWLKQVSQQKQMTAGDSIRFETRSKVPYGFAATQLDKLPIPPSFDSPGHKTALAALGRLCHTESLVLSQSTASSVLAEPFSSASDIRRIWEMRQEQRNTAIGRLVFLQEEIDFLCYAMWGICPEHIVRIAADPSEAVQTVLPGQRPFEILAGRNQDDYAVAAETPHNWPPEIKHLWASRIDAIKSSPNVRLIEDDHYKRRWIGRQGKFNSTVKSDDLNGACVAWLSDRLESYLRVESGHTVPSKAGSDAVPSLISVRQLADLASRDNAFRIVAEVLRDDPACDVESVVMDVIEDEAVPLLPSLRYKPTGLRKHAEWQGVWEQQRQEDAIDARTALDPKHPQHLTKEEAQQQKQQQVGDIPVPPKYTSADFLKPSYWRLRGKLDVPKERFISFPGVLGQDGTGVIAWAGLDHLQLAKAIGDFFGLVQTEYGGSDDPRLVPLLANLSELLPWVRQWHPESLPDYGGPPADFYDQFLRAEAQDRGLTLDQVRSWQPPAAAKKAAKKAAKRATKKKPAEEDSEDEDQEQSV